MSEFAQSACQEQASLKCKWLAVRLAFPVVGYLSAATDTGEGTKGIVSVQYARCKETLSRSGGLLK